MHKYLLVFLLLAVAIYAGPNRAQICPTPQPCPGFGAVATTAATATTLAFEEEDEQVLAAPKAQFTQQQYNPSQAELQIQQKFWNQLKLGNMITPSGHCATSCEWFEIKKGKVRVKSAQEVQEDKEEQSNRICGGCQASWIVYSAPCYSFPNAFIKGEVTGAMAEQVKQQCINTGRCQCDPEPISESTISRIKASVKLDDVKKAFSFISKISPAFKLPLAWNSFGAWFSKFKPVTTWTLGLTGWFQTNPVLQAIKNIWRPKFPFWTKTVSWFKTNKVPKKIWTAVSSAPKWFKTKVLSKVSTTAKKIGGVAKNAAKKIGSVAKNAAKKIGGVAKNVARKFGGAAKKFGSAAKNVARKFGGAAKNVAKKFGSAAKKFGGAAKNVAKKFGGAAKKFGGAAKNVARKFGGAAKKFARKFGGFARKFGGAARKFGGAAKNVARKFGGAAKKVEQKVVASAKKAVSSAKSAVSNTAKRAFGGAKRAFARVGGFFRR